MCSEGCAYGMNILHTFLHKQSMLSITQVVLHARSLAPPKNKSWGRSTSMQKYIGLNFLL